MSDTPNKEPVTVQKFITWSFDEATKLFLEIQEDKAKMVALQSRIAKLEAEVEELKPYKYGYSTRKKPKPHEWVIVDYKEHLYFGYYDDDKGWATQYRDNIREGVRRWYPLPVLSEDFENDPA